MHIFLSNYLRVLFLSMKESILYNSFNFFRVFLFILKGINFLIGNVFLIIIKVYGDFIFYFISYYM